MNGVNKVILIGRLGKDVEMRYTPNGKAVTNFTVATSETWIKDGEKQESTEWHRIVMWGKSAENAAKLLSKGSMVYIEGKLQTRSWDDKDGNKRYTTEINASSWQILGSSGHAESSEPNIDGTPADNGDNPEFDDIPFN